MRLENELQGFEVIPNRLILDNTVSYKARFLYMYMACKPEGWDFYLEPLAKELDLSVGTIRTYIKELIKAGWIEKKGQAHDKESGAFGACIFVLKASNKRDKYQKTPCGENPPSDKKHNTANNIYNKDNNKENNKEEKTLLTESEKGADAPTHSENKDDVSKEVKKRLSRKYNKNEPLTDIEVKFYLGMEKNYPRIMRMDVPFKYSQYQKLLKDGISNKKIIANLEAMENWKILKDRVEAYKVLLTFLKKDRNEYPQEMA